MRIQHNILAMNAYRNYNTNTSAVAKNLEKLSSGYKINRAGDDAAGLAISEKMRAQITGLSAAQKNVKDGISLVKTAEGAMQEIHDMLNRMDYLATQSANGTYDNEVDRANLQKEVNSLKAEIDRIAESANFNGIKLLNGDRAAQSTSALGASSAQLVGELVNGSAPTKAGAAEITVSLKDGSAAAAEAIKGTSTDGTGVVAGTNGSYEITVGGQTSITNAKVESDTLTVTIGGKSYDIDKYQANGTENNTAATQATAWAAAFNADTTHTGYTATVGGAGTDQIVITKNDNSGTVPTAAEMAADTGLTMTDGTNGAYSAGTAGSNDTKFTFNAATASTTAGTAKSTTITDLGSFNLSGLKQGDKLTFKAGGKDYTYTVGSANDNAAAITDLKGQLEDDGFTLDGAAATSKLSATNTVISGLDDGAATPNAKNITAGTTKVSELKDMFLATSNVKLGDYFDIEVYDGTTKKADADVIQNGYTIKLNAKYGGKLDGTAINTDVQALTQAITGATNITGITGTNAPLASLAGGVELTDGSDEGKAPVSKEVSRYTMTFDLAKINAGQSIKIDNTTFKFVNEASGTPATGTVEIDLSTISSAAAGDISKLIQDTITGAGGLEVGTGDNWQVNTALTKTENGKFTLVLETADDKVGADDTNLGAGRVTVGIPDGDTTPPINVTYDRAAYVEDTTGQPTGDPFAKVVYQDDKLKTLEAGDRIYIGDAEIEIVANDHATKVGPLTAKQITLADATGNDAAAKLAKVIEQQKPNFSFGKIEYDKANGKITITGTKVGEAGTDLKKAIGDVKFLDKSANTSAASKAENDNANLAITAGVTEVGDLLDAALTGNAAGGKKLGDIFDITVNGNAKEDNYVIQEGDVVKFTAKVDGKLDDSIMSNFNYTKDITSLTAANGWDEGSNASGNKTRYNLSIDVSKIAGGNSFTFGNLNGKSVTFDLSYDKEGTGNNTVGSNDKDEIADGTTRVTINLYGKSNSEAQEEILKQVKDTMAKNGFNVAGATSGNTLTLNLEAQDEGIAYNYGNIRYSSASDAFSNPVYAPAGGAAGGTEGTHAKVTYQFDASKLQAGDVLTIGGAKVNIVDGKTGTTSVDGALQFNVNLAEAKANPNGTLTQMLESAGFQAGQIRFGTDNKTMTIQSATPTGQTGKELQASIGNVTLTSSTGRAMEEGGLTLQIGDTADNFNQMIVSIGSMFTKDMGTKGGMSIAQVDIGTQAGAKEAIDVIKNAINYVSGIRGDLGATQNRLEHTANNLSIMAENIQDAESTIRDTDIAEEMMAYTKNNILVQSAQAMLAQANQVPQGVLQLLG